MKKILTILCLIILVILLSSCKNNVKDQKINVVVLKYYDSYEIKDGEKTNFYSVVVILKQNYYEEETDYSNEITYLLRVNKPLLGFYIPRKGDLIETTIRELKINAEKVVLLNEN